MVGWSRRAREAEERARRFHKWWQTLTPEQQEDYKKRRAVELEEERRALKWVLGSLLIALGALFFLAWRQS